MERRNFLKGIFGAAVVAAMPKAVVDQIEDLSEPPPVSTKEWKDIEKTFTHGTVDLGPIPVTSENILFIYDKERLIGYSCDFSAEAHMDKTDFNTLEGYLIYSYTPPQYVITANSVHWMLILKTCPLHNKLLIV